MKKRISGFSGLKTLIDEAKEKTPENKTTKKDILIDYKYPLSFRSIRSRFGGDYDVYHNLNRGVSVLSSNEELCQYLFSYGNMHEAKLIEAYKSLFEFLNISENKKIEVLDYACGQGLATIVLLNYIENNFNYCLSNLLKITLIEPSKPALDRAEHFLRDSGRLHCVNKLFDDLTESDLKNSESPTKIHIFSNILDMGDTYFNLKNIADIVSKSQSGVNYFVCVSALNKDKLDGFMNMFKLFKGFESLSSFDGKFTNHQSWKIKFNIFKVGN